MTFRALVVDPLPAAARFQFNWSITERDSATEAYRQDDADRTLILPPNTLPANASYTVKLSAAAFAADGLLTAVHAAHATLAPPLELPRARIVGGDYRTVSHAEAVVIDGSGSVDPTGAPLAFLWGCANASTLGGCAAFAADVLAGVPTGATTLVLPAGSLTASSRVVLSLVVSTADGRCATPALVTVDTLGNNSVPRVTVEAMLPSGVERFSTTGTLRLQGGASYQDTANAQLALEGWRYAWRLFSSPEEGGGASSGVGSEVALATADAAGKDLLLELGTAASLPAGRYVARLSAAPESAFAGGADEARVWASRAGVAEATVWLNAPPEAGVLRVEPAAGVAGETLFELSVATFADPDGPLRVSFWRETEAGRVPLADSALGEAVATLRTVLFPDGAAANLTLGYTITDAYGAAAEARAVAAVGPSGLTFEQTLASAAAAIGAAHDPQLGLQIVDGAVSLLGAAAHGGSSAQRQAVLGTLALAYDALAASPAATQHVAALLPRATGNLSAADARGADATAQGLQLAGRLVGAIAEGNGSAGVLSGASTHERQATLAALSATYGNVVGATVAVIVGGRGEGGGEGGGGGGLLAAVAAQVSDELELVSALALRGTVSGEEFVVVTPAFTQRAARVAAGSANATLSLSVAGVGAAGRRRRAADAPAVAEFELPMAAVAAAAGAAAGGIDVHLASFASNLHRYHASGARAVGVQSALTLLVDAAPVAVRGLPTPVRIRMPLAAPLDQEDDNPYEGAQCAAPTREECLAALDAANATYNAAVAACARRERSVVSVFDASVGDCVAEAAALRAAVDATEAACNRLEVPHCGGHGACDARDVCVCDGARFGSTCGRALRCAFWNGSAFDGAGCREVGMDDGRLVCECDHLTLFEALYEVDWWEGDVYASADSPQMSLPFARFDALWGELWALPWSAYALLGAVLLVLTLLLAWARHRDRRTAWKGYMPHWYRKLREAERLARRSERRWVRALAAPALFVLWMVASHPWIAIFLVKPSDDFKRAHLVMMLYNCILAELCFFVFFFGYDPTPGQAAVACLLDEGVKWLMVLVFGRLFRWAMAAHPGVTALPAAELEDAEFVRVASTAGAAALPSPLRRRRAVREGRWRLLLRQQPGFAWPAGKVNWCEFDPTADNFSRLSALDAFRSRAGEYTLKLHWPGTQRADVVWAQASNPLTTAPADVVGFEHISGPRAQAAKLGRCAEADGRALLVRVETDGAAPKPRDALLGTAAPRADAPRLAAARAPGAVELWGLVPDARRRALRESWWQCARRWAAMRTVRIQRELDARSAVDRQPPRPYKQELLSSRFGAERGRVGVRAEQLLAYPTGRMAMFCTLPTEARPVWVPVLKVTRRPQAWLRLRLDAADEAQPPFLAEYDLVRTDGFTLAPDDVRRDPLSIHDRLGVAKLERGATRGSMIAVAARLPAKYLSVGVKVFVPVRSLWRMQLAWLLQLLLAAFLLLLLLGTLATYWAHIARGGVDVFVYAYLVETLVIQAFACEFREVLSTLGFSLVAKELLSALCCLRCLPLATPVAKREDSSQEAAPFTVITDATLAPPPARAAARETAPLPAEGEELLLELLQLATAAHRLALGAMKAARRGRRWPGAGVGRAEAEGLHAARESDAWARRRAWQLGEWCASALAVASPPAAASSAAEQESVEDGRARTASEVAARTELRGVLLAHFEAARLLDGAAAGGAPMGAAARCAQRAVSLEEGYVRALCLHAVERTPEEFCATVGSGAAPAGSSRGGARRSRASSASGSAICAVVDWLRAANAAAPAAASAAAPAPDAACGQPPADKQGSGQGRRLRGFSADDASVAGVDGPGRGRSVSLSLCGSALSLGSSRLSASRASRRHSGAIPGSSARSASCLVLTLDSALKHTPEPGVATPGELLPMARLLQFVHPLPVAPKVPDRAAWVKYRLERQNHLCARLLACREEVAELEMQRAFWQLRAASAPSVRSSVSGRLSSASGAEPIALFCSSADTAPPAPAEAPPSPERGMGALRGASASSSEGIAIGAGHGASPGSLPQGGGGGAMVLVRCPSVLASCPSVLEESSARAEGSTSRGVATPTEVPTAAAPLVATGAAAAAAPPAANAVAATPPSFEGALERTECAPHVVLSGGGSLRPAGSGLEGRARRESIAEAFRRIDKSGDGVLSRIEVIQACRRDAVVRALLGLPAVIRQEDGTRDLFEQTFQQLDADDSKGVSLDEFVRFFQARRVGAPPSSSCEAGAVAPSDAQALPSAQGALPPPRNDRAVLRHQCSAPKSLCPGVERPPRVSASSEARRNSAEAVAALAALAVGMPTGYVP